VPADFTWLDVAMQSDAPPPAAVNGHCAAHILFTSGSTGFPKGVVVTHDSVRHFIRWAVAYFGTSATDRISCHPPLHFDLSTFDIFGTFAAGAELHLVPPEISLLPHKLREFIRRSQLTQWFSVPSVLAYMAKFDAVHDGDFPLLRRVLWCGDVLPTPVLSHWMRRLPHARFTNLYGPTETAIASSYYTVPQCPERDDEPIPIGRACDGEELLVIDAEGRPSAPGEVGELYIAGVGLSPGYWRDDEKTAAAFVPRSPHALPGDRMYRTGDLASVTADGLVRFVGRADSQIKTRGYRVELGEVEAALQLLTGVRECVAVGVASDGFDGCAICCAYVPSAPGVVTPASLREASARALPAYMVPSRWLELSELPATSNGKIDRRQVRELCAAALASAG
jgi:amino acid adenylation domain-containing protein